MSGAGASATSAAVPATPSVATAPLGLIVLLCWAIHAVNVARLGHAEWLLWFCHVGALMVAGGLILGSARLNAMGALMMSVGIVNLLIDLAWGGESEWTTWLPHLGALFLGLAGVRRLGVPRWSAPLTVAAALPLLPLSRALTTPSENVNLAFSIHPSARSLFDSHPVYLASVIAAVFVYFVVVEETLRRTGFACPSTSARGAAS